MSLTRRHILTLLPAASALPGLAFADVTARPGKRLVIIILRGAMDGLGAVPPLADPDYAGLRGGLALGTPSAPGGALALEGRYWLHPALAPVHPFFAQRAMLVVHAVASPYRERSHFDAQNMIETGLTRPNAGNDGWLNRTLACLGTGGIRGIAFAPDLPLMLKGSAPVSNWLPDHQRQDISVPVARMYAPDRELSAAYAQGLAARGVIDAASAGAPQKRDFASLALIAGKTLAVEHGPNIAVLELGGWDTHVGQGTAKGRLAAALGNLAAGVGALHQGLGAVWADTVCVAMTEFGRTAHPNGTGGTDHGTGTVCLAFGGALAGGRVVADWPGLANGALYQQRDLAPTTDLRSVLKGVLGDHLGVTRAALEQAIFPGSMSARAMQGVIRA
jgi:uncharacterized protein (DUF1501 family)